MIPRGNKNDNVSPQRNRLHPRKKRNTAKFPSNFPCAASTFQTDDHEKPPERNRMCFITALIANYPLTAVLYINRSQGKCKIQILRLYI